MGFAAKCGMVLDDDARRCRLHPHVLGEFGQRGRRMARCTARETDMAGFLSGMVGQRVVVPGKNKIREQREHQEGMRPAPV